METVDDPIGQKDPAGSQVTGRVSRAHVAKVDHAAEIAIPRQEISRVQVPVQPQRRTCPVRPASASSQTSRTASGSEINPRSLVSFRKCAKPWSLSASRPPRLFRPAGASSGAGRCRAARKAARVSAASGPRVAGERSAGSPATQVVTIQGRGNRSEGWPRRCGTGICNGRRGAMAGSKACSLRRSSSAS